METPKVVIVTDTTACIPQEQVAKYGIELVPLDIVFGDKVYRDGIDITPTEFYKLLRQAKKLPTTAASLPARFLEAYCEASKRANNILCITLPAKLSGMFNSAQLAAEMAKKALLNVVIEIFDPGTTTAAQGFVVLAAARAAALGGSLTEVVETARTVMQQVNFFAMLDTLHYLAKGGRVPQAVAWANSLLKIKPIFTVRDGEARTLTLSRTARGGVKDMLRMMEQKIVEGQPLHVAVMQADAPDEAIALKNQISSQFDCAELFITEFSPAMGVHAGPGVIGVAFYCGD